MEISQGITYHSAAERRYPDYFLVRDVMTDNQVPRETIGNTMTIAIKDIPLPKSEATLEAVSKNAHIGMYIVQDGLFKFVNPWFQQDTGYSEAELIGMSHWDIILPEDRDMVKECARNMLRGERSEPYEYRAIAKDGSIRWVLGTVTEMEYQGRRASLGCYMDVTERKQMETMLEEYRSRLEEQVAWRTEELRAAREMADRDALTGLLNHRCLHERLSDEITRCSQCGDTFALILLDVDSFKQYNDTHGHLAGDEVLKECGQLISRSVRAIDISCRYGGDEFAAILPGASLDGASIVAERIRSQIESGNGLVKAAYTCSVGVALWPADGLTREEIVRAADAALYISKGKGRNCVSLSSEIKQSAMPGAKLGGGRQDDDSVLNTILALAAAVDSRDRHAGDHSRKVSEHAVVIARELGYSDVGIERIRMAALVHDIGMIGVPSQVLTRSSPLSLLEWEQVRAHTRMGVAILRHVRQLEECLEAVQSHHEHYDGKGYPEGLEGESIPLDARIIAVADVFDAITSERPYRKPLPPERAVEEIKRSSGNQFDPKVVDAFMRTIADRRASGISLTTSTE
jgi:diguanylate cyclase (GGDEF)-like protein/PAS domain S-box-containing protein